jgi:hypothetical protein
MPEGDINRLTQSVKEVARRHGAALVGVASVDRFDPMPPLYDAVPKGHHPKDFLPEARSVISIAMPVLNPVMDAPAILAEGEMEMIPDHVRYPYFEQLYNRVGHVVHDQTLEFIGQMVGQHLLSQGHQAMIFPTSGLHPGVEGMTDKEIWEGPSQERAVRHSPFRYTFGPFSHRHAGRPGRVRLQQPCSDQAVRPQAAVQLDYHRRGAGGGPAHHRADLPEGRVSAMLESLHHGLHQYAGRSVCR